MVCRLFVNRSRSQACYIDIVEEHICGLIDSGRGSWGVAGTGKFEDSLSGRGKTKSHVWKGLLMKVR